MAHSWRGAALTLPATKAKRMSQAELEALESMMGGVSEDGLKGRLGFEKLRR